MKLSEDVVPLAELKMNPGRIVTRVNESHAPVLLTRRGRDVIQNRAHPRINHPAAHLLWFRAVAAEAR